MTNLNIPVGISDFAQIREQEYYYVDKSDLIFELLQTSATKVTLITRPRRFGKTLAMSMLADFLIFKKIAINIFKILKSADTLNFVKPG